MSKPTFNIKKVNDIRISDYPVGKIIDEHITEPDNYIYPLEYFNNRKLEMEKVEVGRNIGRWQLL